jgi:hypothetical protein
MGLMEKKLLFSITKKDFEIQTFRSGGKGGQNQNKRETGVRIIHKDSGAVGEARDSRYQHQNKMAALKRLVETKKFKIWHKMEVGRRILKGPSIDEIVEDMMQENNMKTEVHDEEGRWVKADILK